MLWASGYVKAAEDGDLSVFVPTLDVNAPATRGDVIQTLMETLGSAIGKIPSTFADVPKTHPYTAAIGLASYYGFVTEDTGLTESRSTASVPTSR